MTLLDEVTCELDPDGKAYSRELCEDCGGEGEAMYPELWPTGHQEVWRTCEHCDGVGYIDIEVLHPSSPWYAFYEVME